MGVVGSQIGIERIFSMAKVIIGLRRCQIGIEHLDKLVLIMKNWPDDLRFGCTNGPKSFEKFPNSESGLVF
jgi:hypothetical protein